MTVRDRLTSTNSARCTVKVFGLATVLALMGLAPCWAQQCNPYCMQQMQMRGFPPVDVQRACCQFNTGQFGQRCMSAVGQCMIPQAIPIGSPCYCATPYGPAGGQVVQ
jgi:hypothetical protein